MIIEAERTGVQRDVLRDRRRHVDPGRARAARGATRGGRPAARAVRRSDERLPDPAEPLEPPAGEAGRTRLERVPAALPLGAPQLRARARVGRRAPAGAHARPGATSARDATADDTTADPDDLHKAILAGLLSHIGLLDERAAASAVRAATRSAAERGSRERRVHRRPRRAVRDLPRIGPAQEEARTR